MENQKIKHIQKFHVNLYKGHKRPNYSAGRPILGIAFSEAMNELPSQPNPTHIIHPPLPMDINSVTIQLKIFHKLNGIKCM